MNYRPPVYQPGPMPSQSQQQMLGRKSVYPAGTGPQAQTGKPMPPATGYANSASQPTNMASPSQMQQQTLGAPSMYPAGTGPQAQVSYRPSTTPTQYANSASGGMNYQPGPMSGQPITGQYMQQYNALMHQVPQLQQQFQQRYPNALAMMGRR